MVHHNEFFGLNAGKAWDVLKQNGQLDVTKLCELADMEEHEAWAALGWLGREGKLNIEKVGKHHVFSLAE